MEAFVIIDMQEGYIGNRRGSKEFEHVLDYINYTAKLFRNAGKPVIVIRDISEGDTEEFRNVKELEVEARDLEVTKVHSNSFYDTKLDELLKDLDVDFLVLAGNAAEYCVTATFFGGTERGYQTTLLHHGVLAVTEVGLASLNQTRPLISYTAIKYLLQSKK